MNLSLNAEQTLLKDSTRRWVQNVYTFERRQHAINTKQKLNRATWQHMADSGWLAVSIPEEYDGLGFGPVETAVICEELGRGLILEPYVASAVFSTQLLVCAGSDEQKRAWLPKMASGELIAAVAYSEPASRGAPALVGAVATPRGGGYVLTGKKSLVVGAPDADILFVSARTPGGVSLFAVDKEIAGLRLAEALLVDGRRSADVIFENVEIASSARLEGASPALPALELALSHAILAQCAESVGAMDQSIAMSADYLKTRHQFGVPIGSFQALQHRIADMAIECEMARSMLVHALRAISSEDPCKQHIGVAGCKAFISQKAKWVTGQAIQLHGGIGMTDEFLAGHYFKRMVASEFIYGGADWHLNRCADALLAEVT